MPKTPKENKQESKKTRVSKSWENFNRKKTREVQTLLKGPERSDYGSFWEKHSEERNKIFGISRSGIVPDDFAPDSVARTHSPRSPVSDLNALDEIDDEALCSKSCFPCFR